MTWGGLSGHGGRGPWDVPVPRFLPLSFPVGSRGRKGVEDVRGHRRIIGDVWRWSYLKERKNSFLSLSRLLKTFVVKTKFYIKGFATGTLYRTFFFFFFTRYHVVKTLYNV